MEGLAGIEDRKCFLVNCSAGEQYAAVERVCKPLDHLVVIDTGSAAEKVRDWSLEKVFVDYEAELGRDGRKSRPLWFEKGGASRKVFAWRR